jgi:hypothetical protein
MARRFFVGGLFLVALLHSVIAASATPEEDFAARCATGGVLVCDGFDADGSLAYSSTQVDGLYPIYGTSTFRGSQDRQVRASGNGSLRFDIPGNSEADVSGNYQRNFKQTFGPGTTFYVQFRQRFDSNFVSINWNTMGTSPKQAVFYDYRGTPCGKIELATVNNYSSGIPLIYSECGGRGVRTSISDRTKFSTDVPYLYQQGESSTSGFNCQYNSESKGSGNGVGCFYYPANKWVTFYYKVSIGQWGQPNSSVQAWVSYDGGPYLQWTNVRDYTLFGDGAGTGYSRVMLTPYMTAKNASVSHPTAYTWYDELIVSTQPIAAPGAAPPTTKTPSAPTNVRAGT